MPDEAPFLPVTGPSAWYGPDLERRGGWLLSLAESEIAEIDRAVARFRETGRPMAAIDTDTFPLPGLRERLKSLLAELLDGRGFFMLRGLPVHRYDLETNKALSHA